MRDLEIHLTPHNVALAEKSKFRLPAMVKTKIA
jgi:hypothetical protein